MSRCINLLEFCTRNGYQYEGSSQPDYEKGIQLLIKQIYRKAEMKLPLLLTTLLLHHHLRLQTGVKQVKLIFKR